MFKSQLLLFAFLFLITDALAARINYSAKFKVGDTDKIDRTSKNAQVADDKQQAILDNMSTWSGGKYTAGMSRHGHIQVANVDPAASKGLASEQVQDMQSTVNQNTRETGGDNGEGAS